MSRSNCPLAEELSAFLVGKLSDETFAEIADHLDTCQECTSRLALREGEADAFLVGFRRLLELPRFTAEPEFQRGMDRALGVPGMAVADAGMPSENGSQGGTFSSRRLGPYQLLEKLGAGGMGAVYKAVHVHLDRVVALKVLSAARWHDDQAAARFRREMKALGCLDHANIVRALDADDEDGTHYLVMEHVDGLDLSEIVRRCRPLRVPDACEVIRQAAVGLQYIHEHGCIHRDLKPSDLMLTPEGQVKILDLGLALLVGDQPTGPELTDSGQPMGTADYVAPEQIADSHGVDIRADIYSLGCTLYKLLAGRAPFSRYGQAGRYAKWDAHMREPVPAIREWCPDVPEDLAAFCTRC